MIKQKNRKVSLHCYLWILTFQCFTEIPGGYSL